MNDIGLGNCNVCGDRASAVYPLLPGSPAFCSSHHNARDAGSFGCDFTGPDDFDIPDDFHVTPKPQALNRDTFIWTDINKNKHPLHTIDDGYLNNIIHFLERGEGKAGDTVRRGKVIEFLKKEQSIRNK